MVVEELPPKVQDIKPITKSPVIDIFYRDMHVVGKKPREGNFFHI